jgi:hypothetical protein
MLSSSFSDPENLLSDICTKVNVFIIQSPVSSNISYHVFFAIVNLAFKNSGYSFVVKDDRKRQRISGFREWDVFACCHTIRKLLDYKIFKHKKMAPEVLISRAIMGLQNIFVKITLQIK